MAWKFVLDTDYSWDSGIPAGRSAAFTDQSGVVRLQVAEDGTITIHAGYAWDGCTPKLRILDLGYIGTPDGTLHPETSRPKVYYPSLIHDALYQFLDHEDMPYDRRAADQLFFRAMEQADFSMRHVYYAASRVLGGISRRLILAARRLSER